MTGRSTSPTRSCCGCGGKAPQAALQRFVLRDGELQPDGVPRGPGRGAYLHPEAGCLRQALRRRTVGRALRVTGVDADALTRRWDAELTPGTA